MNRTLKAVPAFANETEERRFWETHDSMDYVDWSKAMPVRMPNLKPSSSSISPRLPLPLLERIKIAANQRDVPYQSLIKMWLAEKVGDARPAETASTPGLLASGRPSLARQRIRTHRGDT